MLFDALWRLFEERLFPIPSTSALFNQYRDVAPEYDLPDAAQIRRENLQTYLNSFRERPPILIVGEAVGYRGGRFSGIPLISEKQLVRPGAFPFVGCQSSLAGPYSEQTATILWKTLAPHQSRVFTWNSVPLHPHKLDAALSNRTPSAAEIDLFAPLLHEVYWILKPKRLVALGKKAAALFTRLGISHRYVRHPANGGAGGFRSGIQGLFN